MPMQWDEHGNSFLECDGDECQQKTCLCNSYAATLSLAREAGWRSQIVGDQTSWYCPDCPIPARSKPEAVVRSLCQRFPWLVFGAR